MTRDEDAVGATLRSLGWPVYVPAMLWGLGQGAILPVVVTSAVDLGASLGVAGVVLAGIGLGQIAGDLPGGWLVGRVGERNAMLLSAAGAVPALLACVFAPSLWLFAAGVFVSGLCGSVWNLARQTYVTESVPFALRARALSTLAGVHRIGRFVGPFAAVGAMAVLGTAGAYWVHLAAAFLAAGTLLLAADVRPAGRPPAGEDDAATLAVLRRHAPLLRTLGVSVASIGALRASRQAIIPLWGIHIGLDATTISLIFGLSAALDMTLFYPGGRIMDRYGRRWVAVPSTLLLGLAHLLLPLTSGPAGLAVIAALMGLGNGISSGIIMTLGADFAPAAGRPQFLGTWRLFSDVGNGAGPLATSALIAAFSPAAAVVVVGVLGLWTAWSVNRWIPRPVR
ncbi:MFS transporter [Phytohabitans suffuscus]|uniref:MFS transporter n=1 Tax=Phytohabitans suffuscus TaxID=624315 RepID=A0A6F8YZF5_9ACTN|nr:MFS transporter [Phytohabitans suffuscus]BCB91318.1 MFS transporter [Phytohabitans suffuscus]